MWMGLIKSVKGLRNKDRGFSKRKTFCLKIAASNPAQVSRE
jgi:hypothetical protein